MQGSLQELCVHLLWGHLLDPSWRDPLRVNTYVVSRITRKRALSKEELGAQPHVLYFLSLIIGLNCGLLEI